MYYKTYGNTGMKVSAVGFGGMRFDDEACKAGRLEECAEVVRYAYEKGVTYFDSAPLYCGNQSEGIIGMGLKGLPRESYVLSTKTNLGTIDKPATEKGFFDRLEESLRRYNTDYIDVYHLWCMYNPSFVDKARVLLPWFKKAKEQGLIRHVAMSSHMQSEELCGILDEGWLEGITVGYNALNYRFRQESIRHAHALGMGVAIMNPLGGGAIPQNPKYFSYLTKGTGFTVAQAALRFVAEHEEVSVALNGFTTKAQVDEAAAAMEGLCPCPAEEIVARYVGEGPDMNQLCTGCGYCDHCPQGIAIPKFMDVYNQHLFGEDLQKRLKVHWRLRPDILKECIECGQCEGLCTQHLPIIERLKELQTLLPEEKK